VLRIFDLSRPDAPPTLLESSPETPIRAAVWHHSDQTILSSSNDIGGVRYATLVSCSSDFPSISSSTIRVGEAICSVLIFLCLNDQSMGCENQVRSADFGHKIFLHQRGGQQGRSVHHHS
jgi:hypothetical protein